MKILLGMLIVTVFLGANSYANQPVRLESLVEEALQNNPDIKAARARWEASTKRPSQEGSLPDPTIGVRWQNVEFDRITLNEFGNSMLRFPFTQELPFPGKLSLKEKVAKQKAGAQEQSYEAVLRKVTADLKQAYYDWYLIVKSIEITQNNKELSQKFLKISEAKYEVGLGIQQDVIRAQVEVSKFIEQLEILRQQKGVIESKINSILNRPPVDTLGAPEDLEKPALNLTAKDLYKLIEDNSPILKMREKIVESETEALNLAKKQYYPDFSIGVSPGIMGMMGGGIQGIWEVDVGLRVPLYFWRKQRFGVQEAALELSAAREEYSSEKQDILFMVNDNYLAAKTSENLVDLYKGGIIPQSTLSLNSAISGYEVGDIDFLTLLNNLTTLFNFEIEYYRQLAQYHKAIARLEEITGVELTQSNGSSLPPLRGR
jgi:cobalt-zinc-cadmium efflux system outer membrane protein